MLQPWIPELKVQFDGERHFGIEEIAAPLPGRGAHQGGEVVGGEGLQARDGTVARRSQGVARGFHSFARAIQIDIGLRAIFRPDAEEFALRDAFERDKVHGQARQFPVGFFEHAQTQQVVRGVARGCRREQVADQQRQAGVMAKIQGGEPLVFSEARQCFRAGFGEVQGGQCGGRSGGQARTVQPRVRQSKIVPHCSFAICP